MRRLLKASSMTGGASLFNLLASAVRIKYVALLVGTAGIGIFSYLVNFVQVAVSVASLGIASGVVKLTSEYASREREDEIRRLKSTSISLTFWFSILVCIVLLVAAPQISLLLMGDVKYTTLVRLISLSIPCLIFTQSITALLNGYKAIREIAMISVGSGLISVIIVFPLVWKLRVNGVVLHFFLSSLLGLAVAVAFYRRRMQDPRLLPFLSFRGFDVRLVKLLAAFGIATFVMGVSQSLAFLFVRKLIAVRFGESGVGLYQLPFALTLQYLNIVLTALLTYSLPTMSAMQDDGSLREELNKTLRASLLVIVPIIATLLVLKRFLVLLLYSKEFLPSVGLLEVQLLGDFFKVIAFVFGVVVLARARLAAWLLLDLIWDALFIGLSYLLLPQRGLVAVAIAFLGAYGAMSVGYAVYVRRRMKLGVNFENQKLIVLSLLALVSVAVASHLVLPLAVVAALAILSLWMVLCFRKAEFAKGWAMFRNLSWGEDDSLRLP
jgi:PST family polysaccharide transporter